MKTLQYIKVVLASIPVILYYHFRYMLRFSKHPEKYPLEYRYKIVRKEITYVLNRFHVDYVVKGLDKFTNSKEKSLMISNHLGFLDPCCVIARSEKPVTFVAKKEAFKMPFVRHIAKAIEVFPLDRQNIMAQLSTIKEVVSYLKDPNKPSVIIYIEGTRNRHPEGACGEFHAGTLKIAQMAGCPLYVLATYGSFRILNPKSYLKRYPVFIDIFDYIEKDELKQMNTTELANKLKEKVDNQVNMIRKLDKKFVYEMKISEKRKKLETVVDGEA